uniref:Uncharacterized protein n=1 Tax=Timema monikensis TaxID=170555 RepID=A0A7R9E7X7_9NEOP|nr:unnamed protein product [Timema monikensis]
MLPKVVVAKVPNKGLGMVSCDDPRIMDIFQQLLFGNTRIETKLDNLVTQVANMVTKFDNMDTNLSTQTSSSDVKLLSTSTGGKPEKAVEVTKCEVRVDLDKCEIAHDVKECGETIISQDSECDVVVKNINGDCDTIVTISSQVDSWEEFVPQGCVCDYDDVEVTVPNVDVVVVIAPQDSDSGSDIGDNVESEVGSTTKKVECVGGQRAHANFVDTQVDWGEDLVVCGVLSVTKESVRLGNSMGACNISIPTNQRVVGHNLRFHWKVVQIIWSQEWRMGYTNSLSRTKSVYSISKAFKIRSNGELVYQSRWTALKEERSMEPQWSFFCPHKEIDVHNLSYVRYHSS